MRQLLRGALARFGYRVQNTRFTPRQLLEPSHVRVIELADVIFRRMFEYGHEFGFLQIGAYDGISTDPLRTYIDRYGWKGVMLEPQPRAARKLRELYRNNDRIVIVEAALDRERGRRVLYTVESDAAPTWAGGMASFRRDHILKHAYLIPGVEAMIGEITVDCLTFSDVLGRIPCDRFDLLQIDAEGSDAYILSLFPFERVKPAIIHWEVKNLAVSEREQCLARLSIFGYRFALSGGEDMLAVVD